VIRPMSTFVRTVTSPLEQVGTTPCRNLILAVVLLFGAGCAFAKIRWSCGPHARAAFAASRRNYRHHGSLYDPPRATSCRHWRLPAMMWASKFQPTTCGWHPNAYAEQRPGIQLD
jgi:hypothetical protein